MSNSTYWLLHLGPSPQRVARQAHCAARTLPCRRLPPACRTRRALPHVAAHDAGDAAAQESSVANSTCVLACSCFVCLARYVMLFAWVSQLSMQHVPPVPQLVTLHAKWSLVCQALHALPRHTW